MMEPADLELSLRRKDATRYLVELIFNQPGSEADVRPLSQRVVTVSFERERLLAAIGSEQYGRVLSGMLFNDSAVVIAVAQAFAAAQSQKRPLRFRIAIAADAPE